jgi:hypothetical protein
VVLEGGETVVEFRSLDIFDRAVGDDRTAYDRLGERKRFGATGSWSQQNCDAL